MDDFTSSSIPFFKREAIVFCIHLSVNSVSADILLKLGYIDEPSSEAQSAIFTKIPFSVLVKTPRFTLQISFISLMLIVYVLSGVLKPLTLILYDRILLSVIR